MAVGASSPIPTTTASVTRAADLPVLTGLSVPDGCTVLFEGLAPSFVSTDGRMSLSDNSTNNRIWLQDTGTNVAANVQAVSNSYATASVAVAAGAAFKAAVSSQAGTYTGSVNGSAVVIATGVAMPTLTQLDIGTNVGGGRNWNQAISRIRVWKSVRPVQAITS